MKRTLWIIRKDLLRFVADRPGALLTLVLPVVLATLLSLLLAPLGPREVDLLVVDQDGGPRVEALIEALEEDAKLNVHVLSEAEAERRVRAGETAVALTLPKGTNDALAPASMLKGEPLSVQLRYDPSRSPEADLVAGSIIEVAMRHTLEELNAQAGKLGPVGEFGSEGGIHAPLALEMQPVTGNDDVSGFNLAAHTYAGMLCMFLLFMAMEQARQLIQERERGTLTRVRLSGVKPGTMLLGAALSTTAIALMVSAVVYGVGMVAFDVRVGSWPGFLVVIFAQSLFAGGFTLLMAGIARTERQLVNLGTAVILLFSFLGGAWIPSFVLPDWLHSVVGLLPTWWATDGLAAMTWRHSVMEQGLVAGCVLAVMAVVVGVLGALVFRWEVSVD